MNTQFSVTFILIDSYEIHSLRSLFQLSLQSIAWKMSASFFTIKEHIIPCLHIREDLVTTSPEDPEWRMHVRQYMPLNNPSPKEGDLTIIGGHGNGFVKVIPFITRDLMLSLTHLYTYLERNYTNQSGMI
jgi:hypothetical protein